MLADSCVSLSTVAVIGFKITATTATTATAPPVFRALGRAGWGCGIMSPLPGFRWPIAPRDSVAPPAPKGRHNPEQGASPIIIGVSHSGSDKDGIVQHCAWNGLPASRPSAPSPLGEPCNRVYSGVFLSSFRSSLVAAGCRPLFSPPLANEAPGTPPMRSWNHDAKVRPFPRLRKFSGHFFSWISN